MPQRRNSVHRRAALRRLGSGIPHGVAAAGLIAVARINAHELAQLEEVGHTASFFKALVEVVTAAGDVDVLPILFAQSADFLDGGLEAFGGAGHAAVVPHDFAQFAME